MRTRFIHTHSLGSGQCAWPCLAPRSQKHSFASFHVDSESCACRKQMGFPTGNKKVQCLFFLLAENPWVSPPSLQTFRNRFCDWSGVGILGARHFLVSRLRALQAPEELSPLGKEQIDNTQGEACSLPHLILGNCSPRQKGQHGPWSRSLPSSGKPGAVQQGLTQPQGKVLGRASCGRGALNPQLQHRTS